MSLKSAGIIVNCESCKYLSASDQGGFDVTVAINDVETGIAGLARLHCTTTDKHHSVELTEWNPVDNYSKRPTENFLKRVGVILDFFANQRICGNRKICPSEVIRIVEECIY